MNRWQGAALLLITLLVAVPTRAAEPAATRASTNVGGPAISSEVSRQYLFDIPYNMVELGVGGGVRKRSWLAFEAFAVLGLGRTENGLSVGTLGPNFGVDFSVWKLHLEPMAGANFMAVDRITRGTFLADLPWVLGVRAGPSFGVDGSHLAIDFEVRLNMLSTVAHPGYGLRVRYQFY